MDILANINYRALHKNPTPTGGGIVFSIIIVTYIYRLWWDHKLSDELFFVLFVGGAGSTLFGFLDDIINLDASKKLVVQIFLASWVFFWFRVDFLLYFDWMPTLILMPLVILFVVWMINAYNFMDGIDGMAAMGAVFVSSTIALLLLLTNSESELILPFVLLSMSVAAFLFFNWPPASIFMGDSGSVFLGYIFGSLILYTIIHNEISVWTWIVVFGYFFADTTVTQIARFVLVKKWYIAHRSHAYQNLARITDSHFKVTSGVAAYHVIWLLPLSLWTVFQPEMALLASALAVIPALLVAYKYGPILSSS